MQACFCGSGQEYSNCCGAYITGAEAAPTAEALMRSRYSAYVVKAIDYLGETLHPGHCTDWDKAATQKWADESEWLELQIVFTEAGSEADSEGWVEFIAKFKDSEGVKQHHERSRFAKIDGRWYYVEGDLPRPETYRHTEQKIGRNDPCICGSGKKYKKCCG